VKASTSPVSASNSHNRKMSATSTESAPPLRSITVRPAGRMRPPGFSVRTAPPASTSTTDPSSAFVTNRRPSAAKARLSRPCPNSATSDHSPVTRSSVTTSPVHWSSAWSTPCGLNFAATGVWKPDASTRMSQSTHGCEVFSQLSTSKPMKLSRSVQRAVQATVGPEGEGVEEAERERVLLAGHDDRPRRRDQLGIQLEETVTHEAQAHQQTAVRRERDRVDPGATNCFVTVPSGAPTDLTDMMSVQYIEPSGPKVTSSGATTPSSGPYRRTTSPLSTSKATISPPKTLATYRCPSGPT
jgi:hypothetical protein